jgi:poly(A) polymerase
MSAATNEQAALEVLRTLRAHGHVAYFAGGCVRDRLLGLVPKDHDVATSATPKQVRDMFRNSQAVGASFGVVLVRSGGINIEVATFRTDGTYSDGRRPDAVRFSTPREDARRRDFTINGLFLDPETGQVIDHVGGQADLAARVLRAIGDPEERFREDHLRLLRAVRFAARFDLAIDEATAAAVRKHAMHLRGIVPDRTGEELRRMLVVPTRARAFGLLRELGLAVELCRFLSCPDEPTLDLLGKLGAGGVGVGVGVGGDDGDLSYPLVLAAMALSETDAARLNDDRFASEATAALRRALRLSNDDSDGLLFLLSGAHELTTRTDVRIARLRRLLADRGGQDLVRLLDALLLAGLRADIIGPLLPRLRQLQKDDNAPPPLLTGDDLLAEGLKPGPIFRKLLDTAYDAQLEGKVRTREEAISYALSMR